MCPPLPLELSPRALAPMTCMALGLCLEANAWAVPRCLDHGWLSSDPTQSGRAAQLAFVTRWDGRSLTVALMGGPPTVCLRCRRAFRNDTQLLEHNRKGSATLPFGSGAGVQVGAQYEQHYCSPNNTFCLHYTVTNTTLEAMMVGMGNRTGEAEGFQMGVQQMARGVVGGLQMGTQVEGYGGLG